MLDRIHHLIPRPPNWDHSDDISVGDVVLFKFKENASSKLETWKVGRVKEITNDGRRLTVSYFLRKSRRLLVRSPRDVCVISTTSDLNLNSREFFERVKIMK